MQFINHRVNTVSQLTEVPVGFGMEIDLRADMRRSGALVIHHDAWAEGEDFEAWLKTYKNLGHTGTVIFNTKEDGLEQRICDLASEYGVRNYFFLDTAFPTLVSWTQRRNKTFFAARVSKYEDWKQFLNFDTKPEWLWMDCFDGMPLSPEVFESAAEHFKLCLVSPELQGQPIDQSSIFLKQARLCSAICTKNPSHWRALLR